MRIVSLVPSTTELVAALGRADDLVGVTKYCTVGAPATAQRVGGTKNPAVATIAALRPDVVLANTEENRPDDLAELRSHGLTVHETLPKTVAQARDVVVEIGRVIEREAAARAIAVDIDEAMGALSRQPDAARVVALTLIWRRPWMAVGPDTYADDLLWQCGFANALSGADERYPKVEPGLHLGADVVLLPSEPYEFTDDDLPAVRELAPNTRTCFVDGELLTWHGVRTAEGLQTFGALARSIAAAAQDV